MPLWPLEKARANATPLAYAPVVPRALGRRVFKNFDLAELVPFLDWGPFFQTWDLAGAFPAILDDEIVGTEARKVFADGQAMLQKIVAGRWLTANGVMGLFPANRVGDDIEFYTDESRSQVLMTWYGLRQQTEKQVDAEGRMRPSRCLADFVAPKDSGMADYAGLFAVTAGIGSEKKEKSSSTRSTTTAPSCSKAWPTAWPKPLPNACTSACARTCGVTARANRSATRS